MRLRSRDTNLATAMLMQIHLTPILSVTFNIATGGSLSNQTNVSKSTDLETPYTHIQETESGLSKARRSILLGDMLTATTKSHSMFP